MRTIVMIIIFIGFNTITYSQEKRLVTTKLLNVRSGTGVNYEVINQLREGDTVISLDAENTWSKIELVNGEIGYVSNEFLSEPLTTDPSQSKHKKGDSKVGTIFIIVIVIGIILLNDVRKKIFPTSKKSSSRWSPGTKQVTKSQSSRPPISRNSANGVVYRYRIKGNGTAGGFKYVEGMNVEIAVKGLGASGSPFNTITEKLFIQEIARKYNIEPRFQSGIKMLFKHDRVDVEIM